MKAYFTKFQSDTNWCDGVVTDGIKTYQFQSKLLDIGSSFGINEGRVLKLAIWDEDVRVKKQNFGSACIVHYERGWDIEPVDSVKGFYDCVMELLENASKRFDEGLYESLSKLS